MGHGTAKRASLSSVEENAHPPGPEPLWAETWQFDFVAAGGAPAGFVALHRYPNLGVAWYWASFVTPSGLVAVRDHEVPPPKAGLEIRTDGLWAELVCETPLEHWSGGLEAFGIRYDDPADAWGDEWGHRLAVGLDFEWELTGPPVEAPVPGPPGEPEGAFLQPGTMWGEILVGPSVRLPFEGTAVKSRRWGVADWWSAVGDPVRSWSAVAAADVAFDEHGLPLVGGPVLAVAPLLITGPEGRRARLARAVCRTADGFGWGEWLRSP
jgi:hypothetical protein